MELGISRDVGFDEVRPGAEATVRGMDLGMLRCGGLDEARPGAEPTASSGIGRNDASGQRASFPNGHWAAAAGTQGTCCAVFPNGHWAAKAGTGAVC